MASSEPETAKFALKRHAIPDTLAESLRDRILSGEFKEGDPLVQEVIAAEYAVSRMPVREALRQLEATGLVELRTHKGAVVTSIPVNQIKELYELRELLECDLLRRAIPNMKDEDFAASAQILDKLEIAFASGDVHSWGALNWEFHHSLYIRSNREQTLAIVRSINLQTDRYVRLQLLLTSGFADADTEHRELLGLCKDRNAAKAVTQLSSHIRKAGRILVGAMKKGLAGT